MTLSIYKLATETYVPALRSLSELLDKGAQHMRAKGADPEALLNERLAPDMFPLAMQVKLACFHVRSGSARATGQDSPKPESKDLTLAELKEFIEQTIQSLTGTNAKAFDGAEERKVELPLQKSRVFESNGLQFLMHWSFPHFYFHVVTAYDILRHIGVPLGKTDYMNKITDGYIRQLEQA
jgi:uncharacterized protein